MGVAFVWDRALQTFHEFLETLIPIMIHQSTGKSTGLTLDYTQEEGPFPWRQNKNTKANDQVLLEIVQQVYYIFKLFFMLSCFIQSPIRRITSVNYSIKSPTFCKHGSQLRILKKEELSAWTRQKTILARHSLTHRLLGLYRNASPTLLGKRNHSYF